MSFSNCIRKKNLFVFVVASAIIFSSCKKDDGPVSPDGNTEEPELSIEPTPSANPEDNNKSSGIYKGTFVGSTGSFKLVLQSDQINGVIEVDGKGYNLTTTDIQASDLGSAISNAVFTDASGTVSLTFSVEADGSNPTVALQITGHSNVQAAVFKETSVNQVKVFEGYMYNTYPSSGVVCKVHLNVVLLEADTLAKVTYKETGEAISISDTSAGTCGSTESWSADYVYHVNADSIEIYHWVEEVTGDPSTAMKDDLLFEQSTYSENTIFSVEEWSENGMNYADSTRLVRKL